MLKIAVPNKGGLSDASAQLLREAGYRQRADQRGRRHPRALVGRDPRVERRAEGLWGLWTA